MTIFLIFWLFFGTGRKISVEKKTKKFLWHVLDFWPSRKIGNFGGNRHCRFPRVRLVFASKVVKTGKYGGKLVFFKVEFSTKIRLLSKFAFLEEFQICKVAPKVRLCMNFLKGIVGVGPPWVRLRGVLVEWVRGWALRPNPDPTGVVGCLGGVPFGYRPDYLFRVREIRKTQIFRTRKIHENSCWSFEHFRPYFIKYFDENFNLFKANFFSWHVSTFFQVNSDMTRYLLKWYKIWSKMYLENFFGIFGQNLPYWPVRPGRARGAAWSVGPARRRHRRRLVALDRLVTLAATPLAGHRFAMRFTIIDKYSCQAKLPPWCQGEYQGLGRVQEGNP